MPTFAIANPEPASGKTTTAIALASYLGAYGASVLLVDADPEADLTGATGRARTMEWQYALRHEHPMSHCVAPSTISGVDLMMATEELRRAERRFAVSDRPAPLLRDALAPVQGRYTYTLIDCPGETGLLTVSALAAADAVVIPIPCERESVAAAARFVRAVDDVRRQYNPSLLTYALMVMNDGTSTARETIARMRATPGATVLNTVVPVDTTVRGVVDGYSILYSPLPAGAAYERLAAEVGGVVAPAISNRQGERQCGYTLDVFADAVSA